MAPRLTDYQEKRIITSYVENGTYRAAARACQVSVNTVRKLVQSDTEMLKKAEQKKSREHGRYSRLHGQQKRYCL